MFKLQAQPEGTGSDLSGDPSFKIGAAERDLAGEIAREGAENERLRDENFALLAVLKRAYMELRGDQLDGTSRDTIDAMMALLDKRADRI